MDHMDDTQVRRLVEAIVPSGMVVFPPSTVTPAELRQRAQARRAKRRFWSLRW